MEKRVSEIREQIVRDHPGVYEHVAELGHAYVYLARLLETTDPQAAEDLFRRGLHLQKDAPGVATYQEFLGIQQRFFGVFLARRDRPDEAIAAYRQAVAIYQKLLARFPHVTSYREALNAWQGEIIDLQRPNDARHRLALARRYYTEGLRLHMSGRYQEAESTNRRALEHSQRLVAELPNDEIYRFELAVSYFHLGLAQRGGRRLEHAEQSLRRAVEILEKLVGESRTSEHRRVLGVVCCDLATVLLAARRPQEAEKAFRQSLSLLEDSDPNKVNWLQRMGSHAYLTAILKASGRAHEAEEQLGRLLELAPNSDKQNEFVWILVVSPDWPDDAAILAVELAKGVVGKVPKEGRYWTTLGAAHYRAGEWNAAITALEKSMELRKGGDSHDGLFLAMAHWQLGDKEQARKHYDRAAQWMEKNRPQDKELRRFHVEAAALLGLPEPLKEGDAPKKEEKKPQSK